MKSNKRQEMCDENCACEAQPMRSCSCSKTFVGVITVVIGVLWLGLLYSWWSGEFVHFTLAILLIAAGVSLIFRRKGHCCR